MTDLPNIPDDMEELKNLLDKDFEVVRHGLPDPNFQPGGISITRQLVKCPFCSNEFIQEVASGCFNIQRTPFWCPECNFPENIRDKYLELAKDLRSLNKSQDDESVIKRLAIE